MYRNLEELLVKSSTGCEYETKLDLVCEFYKDDVSKDQLQAQLPLLNAIMIEQHKNDVTKLTIKDIIASTQELSKVQQIALSSVWVLLKLLLVMPATDASLEHSFSALQRIKTSAHNYVSRKT